MLYMEYVRKIKENPIAKRVKLADLRHNSDMTRKEEIEKAATEFYKGDEVSTFVVAAQWADKTMIERLRELKSDYEKDLDAEPRMYERDIQLCAKISLIERLILELKEE